MDDQVFLIDRTSDKCHGADAIGSKIVGMLDGERSVMRIIDELSAKYDVDPSVCEHDVLKFLHLLQEQNLISVR
jgi:hypothetical protein